MLTEVKMTDISFCSAYRIPITQAGVNSAKKARLKKLVESYPNGLIGRSKTGYARISVPDSDDAFFIGKLKAIGYKVFQKFEGNNIPKENLDSFIKEKLDAKDFAQKGKQAARMSKDMKAQRRFERNFVPSSKDKKSEVLDNLLDLPEQEKISNSQQFEDMVSAKIDSQAKTESPESLKKIRSKGKNQQDIDMDFESKIRNSEKYLEYKEKYGQEFADAVFFDIR